VVLVPREDGSSQEELLYPNRDMPVIVQKPEENEQLVLYVCVVRSPLRRVDLSMPHLPLVVMLSFSFMTPVDSTLVTT